MITKIAELWKDERYTIVPDALYQRCEQLNEATALFYCRLMDDYLNETRNYHKDYFPRNKELAIRFRIDEKTVKSRMKTLENLGLIIKTPNPGYANFIKVVNFRTLDILDDTNVKEEIEAHRNQRKVERAEQQQVWIEKKTGVVYDEADFDEAPVTSLKKEQAVVAIEPIRVEQVAIQTYRPPVEYVPNAVDLMAALRNEAPCKPVVRQEQFDIEPF